MLLLVLLIFWLLLLAGRKSATAATLIKISVPESSFFTAENISCALVTLVRVAPEGASRNVGPEISVTFAPASSAALATA